MPSSQSFFFSTRTSTSLSEERKYAFLLSFKAVVYIIVSEESVARTATGSDSPVKNKCKDKLESCHLHRLMEGFDFIPSYSCNTCRNRSCIKMQGLLSCVIFFTKCLFFFFFPSSMLNRAGLMNTLV